jgi:MEKHLA domain
MEPWEMNGVRQRVDWVLRSHRRWTGRDLLVPAPGADAARAAWEAPFVLVSHGTEADPVLWYGNRTALDLWEMEWPAFTATPSRFTAEAPLREERARLMAAVTARGFIDDYAGIRITRTGRRFRIHRATVWNVVDDSGAAAGQAATFSDWDWIG